jgi:spermidine synthase
VSAQRWIAETLHDDIGVRIGFEAARILHESRTQHQHLVLFENARFGKVMMLDGAVQLSSADEFIYHEMMAHVPLCAHGAAREVLIVGGGDCGVAAQVLKHTGVERLTQVEIDAAVVDFARQHFPELTSIADGDVRFELAIADGVDYVSGCSVRFDAIIVDSTDPVGLGAALFTRDFYAACRRALRPGGVLVTQSGAPFLQADELAQSIRNLSASFADATCYVAAVPSYFGGHMALGWASDDPQLRHAAPDALAERHRAAGSFSTQYWTPEVQVAAFALPRYIDEIVAAARGG